MRNRINSSKWLSCAVLSAVAIGGVSLPHAANTDTWTGAVDTNWSTATSPTNWSGGIVPANGDSLVFDDTGTGLVNTDDLSGLSVAGLAINGSTNSYTLNGALPLTLTGGATALVDGSTVKRADDQYSADLWDRHHDYGRSGRVESQRRYQQQHDDGEHRAVVYGDRNCNR